MSRNKMILSLCQLTMIILFVACKADVPSKYLSESEMEDILYDYHLADALAQDQPKDSTALISYKANILKKYGITEAELDSSMLYYTRHTELLHKIYKSLSDRFSNEAVAQGASATEVARFSQMSSSIDTADVWNAERAILLFPNESFNSYSFKIKADTTYHKGDAIMLDFESRFLYQDGMRSATAILSVKHSNDSITTKTIHLSSTSHFHLQIDDFENKGIKEIRGCFILNVDRASFNATTLKLASISNICLIRMHVDRNKKEDEPSASRVDSARVPPQVPHERVVTPDSGATKALRPVAPINNKFQPNKK